MTTTFSLKIDSYEDISALELIIAPNAILNEPVTDISSVTEDAVLLAKQMAKTMYTNSGVGIAGNQVKGIEPVRAIVFDPLLKKVKGTPIADPHVIFNPVIVASSEEGEVEEGCLSFPTIFLKKKRAGRIIVRGLDVNNEEQEIEVYGITAAIIQHEIDHLNGKTMIDDLSMLKKSSILRKLKKATKS